MTDAPYEIPAEAAKPVLPPENVGRGLLFSLVVIPAGIIIWTLIWAIGFVASIVAFAVAAGAVWLYRKGSGGRVSIAGVIVIAVVTLATLVLAFLAGLVWDYAAFQIEGTDMTHFEAIAHPLFWPYFGEDLPTLLEGNGFNILLALGFGVLGAFAILRGVFKEAKAAPAESFDFPISDPNAAPGAVAAPTTGTPAPGATAVPPVAPAAPVDAAPAAPADAAPESEPKA